VSVESSLLGRNIVVSLSRPTAESRTEIVEIGDGQTRRSDDSRLLSLGSLCAPFFFSLVRTEVTLRGGALCAAFLLRTGDEETQETARAVVTFGPRVCCLADPARCG
jgi:hypothetical protein